MSNSWARPTESGELGLSADEFLTEALKSLKLGETAIQWLRTEVQCLTRFLARCNVKERPTPLLEPRPEYSSGSLKETDPLLSQGKVEVQADIDPLSKPSAKIPLKTALP